MAGSAVRLGAAADEHADMYRREFHQFFILGADRVVDPGGRFRRNDMVVLFA